MSLPDINDMYPQKEQTAFSRCAHCGDDIFKGDEIIENHAYDFCKKDCVWESMIQDGTIVIGVAGDDITRIV